MGDYWYLHCIWSMFMATFSVSGTHFSRKYSRVHIWSEWRFKVWFRSQKIFFFFRWVEAFFSLGTWREHCSHTSFRLTVAPEGRHKINKWGWAKQTTAFIIIIISSYLHLLGYKMWNVARIGVKNNSHSHVLKMQQSNATFPFLLVSQHTDMWDFPRPHLCVIGI